ncbi:DUF2155 domain-containing protein [Roseovarius salinarum]|uniref:DUF2155 domain-containing protein n=1 Tax=Roseovarius salinarum TaxID=1981892 RepID=UPI000C3434ED|nr:DUF2155 domain-containing protein [Roseovarius salinarum]
MRVLAPLAGVLMFAAGAAAQEQPVTQGSGAVVRALDKVTGKLEDLEIAAGGAAEFGRISVSVRECRYPQDDPAGDAYAFLDITTESSPGAAFSGWMIASSPALNALDHPRYDVWVLRCTTE